MNKTIFYIIALAGTASMANAQTYKGYVGVNTSTPTATLDVAGNPTDTTVFDGVIAPRITGDQLFAKTYTAAQTGALVYATAAAAAANQTGQTVNVNGVGYYYFDGTVWVHLTDTNAQGMFWAITGNAGTVAGTNFLGTTDDQDLVFKRNNVQAGWLNNNNTTFGVSSLPMTTTGINNTGLGKNALAVNTTGNNNTAIGNGALLSNTTGNSNVAIGNLSMRDNTSGASNTGVGMQTLINNTTGTGNFAGGQTALTLNSTGVNNTALGGAALYNNVAGNNGVAIGVFSQRYVNNQTTAWTNTNTSVGFQSLNGTNVPANNTGLSNTAIGYQSLAVNSTGSSNVAIGYQTGYNNASGNNNIIMGYQAGFSGTTSNDVTAIGYKAGYANATDGNMFIGPQAGLNNTTGGNNTFIGSFAGKANTTNSANTFVGYFAGGASTGDFNTFMGHNAGQYNTGTTNTFIGNSAGSAVTQSGSFNNFFGHAAGLNNTTGYGNSFFGTTAGAKNTTGSHNSFVGTNSGYSNTTGTGNMFIGESSGFSNTIGSQNIYLGYSTGYSSTGSKNVFLGDHASFNGAGSGSNNILIGGNNISLADGNADNQLNIGNLIYGTGLDGVTTTVSSGNIGIGIKAPTNRLHVFATADPLRLEGLQTGAATDQILTVDATGVVKKQTAASVTAATEPWFNVATGTGATANTQNIYQMGNIGINNNSPIKALDVIGTGRFVDPNPNIIIKDSDSPMTSVAYTGSIDFRDSANNYAGYMGFGSAGNNTLGLINKTTMGDLTLGTNDAYRLYITVGGNVGINTTAPTNLLHVKSTTDPLRLEGLQTGAATDQILTVDATGVVKQQAASSINAVTLHAITTPVSGTSYTNSTGKTMNLVIEVNAPTPQLSTAILNADGINQDIIVGAIAWQYYVLKAVVPPGSNYILTLTGGATVTNANAYY